MDKSERPERETAVSLTEADEGIRRVQRASREYRRSNDVLLTESSHDIRTPLNAIVGMAHLLLKTALTPRQREYMRIIQQSAKSLTQGLDAFMEASEALLQKPAADQSAFSLAGLIESLGRTVRPLVESKGLAFEVVVQPELPEEWTGDVEPLLNALETLVKCAAERTQTGSVTVRVSEFEMLDTAMTLLFSVRDTGDGLDSDLVGKLFSPFPADDLPPELEELRLNCTLARSMVSLLGGDLWSESASGEGTTVFFTAKFECEDTHQSWDPITGQGVQRIMEAEPEPEPEPPVRILLVEDNEINQIIATAVLTSEGYVVEVAGDGLEAVEMVEKNQNYDMIFMDIQMPRMDGFAATGRIRSLECGQNIPIVAMTAYARAKDAESSIDAGMNAHIVKPVSPDLLIELTRKWTKR